MAYSHYDKNALLVLFNNTLLRDIRAIVNNTPLEGLGGHDQMDLEERLYNAKIRITDNAEIGSNDSKHSRYGVIRIKPSGTSTMVFLLGFFWRDNTFTPSESPSPKKPWWQYLLSPFGQKRGAANPDTVEMLYRDWQGDVPADESCTVSFLHENLLTGGTIPILQAVFNISSKTGQAVDVQIPLLAELEGEEIRGEDNCAHLVQLFSNHLRAAAHMGSRQP